MTGNNVLIIGNGFDLDLGYKTRYSDFAQSEYWPFGEYAFDGLEKALIDAKNKEKWFDIEKVLEDYASLDHYDNNYFVQATKDKETFELLSEGLTKYLKMINGAKQTRGCLAQEILKRVIHSNSFNIYTFNYTNLEFFARDIGIKEQINFKYVHGNLNDGIILGVREGANLVENYDFLRKTFSHHYQSNQIPYDLQEADNIIFFGHSLSQNDAHYFESFFKDQMRDDMSRKKSKNILFFTFNEDSEREIKRQLSNMCEGRLDKLYNHNDIHFILTKNGGCMKDYDYINRLFIDITHSNKRSKGVNYCN